MEFAAKPMSSSLFRNGPGRCAKRIEPVDHQAGILQALAGLTLVATVGSRPPRRHPDPAAVVAVRSSHAFHSLPSSVHPTASHTHPASACRHRCRPAVPYRPSSSPFLWVVLQPGQPFGLMKMTAREPCSTADLCPRDLRSSRRGPRRSSIRGPVSSIRCIRKSGY
jgi:hypothetical protein